MDWSRFLPPPCDDYRGSRLAFYFLIFVAVVSTVRSLIHIFAPDGGAGSIAGLAVDVEGGANIVAMFGQWGASQLILALFYWLAILRYRSLVPLMLAVGAMAVCGLTQPALYLQRRPLDRTFVTTWQDGLIDYVPNPTAARLG